MVAVNTYLHSAVRWLLLIELNLIILFQPRISAIALSRIIFRNLFWGILSKYLKLHCICNYFIWICSTYLYGHFEHISQKQAFAVELIWSNIDWRCMEHMFEFICYVSQFIFVEHRGWTSLKLLKLNIPFALKTIRQTLQRCNNNAINYAY